MTGAGTPFEWRGRMGNRRAQRDRGRIDEGRTIGRSIAEGGSMR